MPPMRFFTACVRNGRLTLDEPIDLADGTCLELVSTDDLLENGGDLLEAEERVELAKELAAADAEIEAGQVVDAADFLAELRASNNRASRQRKQVRATLRLPPRGRRSR